MTVEFASSIARYLRIGESFVRPVAASEVAPGEMGETGGVVARYLKIQRHDRPVAKQRSVPKQRSAPKQRPPTGNRPAEFERPAKKNRHLRVHHEAPKAARHEPKAAPRKVQCPDCDAMVSPAWGQCPNCALLLDIAA